MQKRIAAGGNDYRIDHKRHSTADFADKDRLIPRATTETISPEQSKPVFTAAIGKLFGENIDLCAHHFGADRFDSRNVAGRFGDDACNGRQAINPERAECFKVGLDAGSGAAVRSGDGERDGNL